MTSGRKGSADKAKPIQDMAETIGMRLALKLVQVYGGLDVKFPRHPHDDHPVIVALGKEDGYAICRYMDGSSISVPHGRPAKSARADIARLEAQGLSRAEIAKALGLTQRYIRMIANEPENVHPDLFSTGDRK